VELLAELDPQLITKTRLGARKAQELYRSVRPWRSDELLPLELVQIDHTQLDVMVVDESQRMVLGRPWLTLAIDVASRVVTGFYVSLDAPAAISVAIVLTHAVLPKDLWSDETRDRQTAKGRSHLRTPRPARQGSGLRAQAKRAVEYKHVAVEVPLRSPQIEYDARCDQWVPRGGVLRCLIHDEELRLVVEIDDHELRLEEFGKLLAKVFGLGHAN
jgi:transposase InsO family protein